MSWLSRFFYGGFSAESLGLLRIWLALALGFYALDQFESLQRLDPSGPGFYYIDPIWYFGLLGIDHVVPELTVVALVLVAISAVSAALGFYTRTSIAVLLLSIAYLKGVRDSMSGDVHHRLLIPAHLLFLLMLSKAGAVLSLDRWRRPSRAQPEPWEASWPIRAMQIYCAGFYLFGGVAKLRLGGLAWFDGERIRRLLVSRSAGQGITAESDWSWPAVSFEFAQWPELCLLLGVSVLFLEIGFPIVLWLRSAWFRLGFLAGAASFHLANYLLVGVQFLFMPIFYVVFFDLAKVVPLEALRARVEAATRSR